MWFINGTSYVLTEMQKNQVLIDSCAQLGLDIPRFCYHENLKIAGNCRMCLIEDSKSPKPVISCAGVATADLNIFTNTLQVKKARESVMEFLLINHPLDCPICDQGGECDLQDLALVYGSDHGRFYDYKRNVEDKNFGPIVKTIMNRCILCTRCVRFATDVAGLNFFGITGRGGKMEIGSYIEKIIDSELSGNIIDVCPVGALTSKPYSFVSRPWELKKYNFLNLWDDYPQLIRADIKENEIVRILPSKNNQIDNIWITNRTRFSYEGLRRNRLEEPEILGTPLSWNVLLKVLKDSLKYIFKLFGNFDLNNKFAMFTTSLKALNFSSVQDINFIKAFFASLGSAQLIFYNDLKNKRDNFLFIPFTSRYNIQTYNRYLFLETNVAFDIPIMSIALIRNYAFTSSIFISWRSVPTNLMLTQSINLGISVVALFKFLLGKTWLNFVKCTERLLCYVPTRFTQLLFNIKNNYNLMDIFLITKNITSRAIIDSDFSSFQCTHSNLFFTSLVSYVSNNDLDLSFSHASPLNLLHITHRGLSLDKFYEFLLPNKIYLERSNQFYLNEDYSYLFTSHSLKGLGSPRSLYEILRVLTNLIIKNNVLVGFEKTKLLLMSSIKKKINFYNLFSNILSVYFLSTSILPYSINSHFEYYNTDALISNSPTLSAARSSSLMLPIY